MPACASRHIAFWAALLICSAVQAEEPSAFLDEADISWKLNDFSASRWKTLIGGAEGGQLDAEDIQFGLWQLAPGATYHGHRHDSPEIYYILEGRAVWSVGDETRHVTAGTAIHTRPGQIHRMENRTDQLVKAIWVWWAPGGDTKVFSGSYEFTEPRPKDSIGFSPSDGEKIY